MNPNVVIGIPNWNGRNVLDECLHSIYSLTDYDGFSVVVVDNGSSDGSVEMIESKYGDVTLIRNDTNEGVPKAFNQIIESARTNDSDYIVLMNSDIKIQDPDWLFDLVSIAELDGIGVIGCKNVTSDGEVEHTGDNVPLSPHTFSHSLLPFDLRSKYNYNRHDSGRYDRSIKYTDLVQGSVMMLDLKMVDEIGGFDMKYSPAYFADYDYCIRAYMNGYKVAYASDVAVVHGEQESGLGETERLYYFKRNELRFILTYYPVVWLFFTLPGFLLPPTGVERFFIGFDDGDMILNPAFASHPLKIILFFLNVFVYNIVSLPEIIRTRGNNADIRDVLK